MPEIPTKAKRICRFVVFALHHKLRAAVVEPEDFVVQIQTGDDRSNALPKVVAGLRVNLEMRVEIIVTVGSLDTAGLWVRNRRWRWRGVGRKVVIHILENVWAIVGETDADRQPPSIVGGTDVPGIRRLAEKRRVVGAE